MTTYQVNTVSGSGHHSEETHFNSNFLPGANTGSTPWDGETGNPHGRPTDDSIEALIEFGVDHVRFPAGQDKEFFSDYGILVDGQLSDPVKEFLAYASANNLTVNMVVPVETLEPHGGVGVPQLYDELETFARLIGEQYPGVVTAYELGNEYWGGRTPGDEQPEVEYGIGAGNAAAALEAGMAAANYDANVIIQASGNLRGAFGNDVDTANAAIQTAFESVLDPTGVVDGVLRNFYWRDADEGGFDNDSGLFLEDRGLEMNLTGSGSANWEAWAGGDLLRIVGEYNINRNISLGEDGIDIGVHGASMFLEHYTNLVEADVDYSFVWPVLHSTTNSLVNRNEDIEITTINGLEIVTNSTRAAMFDILSQTVVGMELMDIGFAPSTTENDLELTVFSNPIAGYTEGETRDEIFLSSRSPLGQEFTVDLSVMLGTNPAVTGYVIGYANDGGHHRDAVLTQIDVASMMQDGVLTVFLEPYQVLHITHTGPVEDGSIGGEPSPFDIVGTDGDDRILNVPDDVSIDAGAGNDFVSTGGGIEQVHGGTGNDTIFTGAGDDEIHAGDGDDLLRGDGGNDNIFGEDGNDSLLGSEGNDTLTGGAGQDFFLGGTGDDFIFGGLGNDSIHGEDGDDQLWGDEGADTIRGENGNDVISGGDGNDVLLGGGNSDTVIGGDGDDNILGNWGFDELQGGAGNDTLNGGTGSDTMTGGTGADSFYFADFENRRDFITDFSTAEDVLVFDAGKFDGNFNGVAEIAWDGGTSTIIRYLNENGVVDTSLGGIVLQGVSLSEDVNIFVFGG